MIENDLKSASLQHLPSAVPIFNPPTSFFQICTKHCYCSVPCIPRFFGEHVGLGLDMNPAQNAWAEVQGSPG